MPDVPKINLVYVASIGRSGSTLLESMLGSHSQMTTIGEVHLWPHEILDGGVLRCGSGKYVQNDPFWIEMRRRVAPLVQPSPRLHFFREKHNLGRSIRLERLREFGRDPLSPEVAAQVEVYGRNNYTLFKTFLDLIEETSGRRPAWVVDASKDLYRLLWLARSGRFNLKVLHVVRNPRGFAYSITKRWIHSGEPRSDLFRFLQTVRHSLAWTVQNHLIATLLSNHVPAPDTMRVRYEELASQPHETFQQICSMLGCDYESEAVDDFRRGNAYTIGGNPMRYEQRGIKLDEKWRTQLPRSSRLIVDLVTSPTRTHFGYQ